MRSLRAIPSYFIDPATLTTNREQADYRPLLQATYALDYRLGGYDMWWWHFTQILLHALVTLGIYALCRRVLAMTTIPRAREIAFAAAAIFAVHPAASGVVNYLNARSSLLTAVFLLPALLAYMRPIEDPRFERPQWLAAAMYGLALFTKVEAVGLLGALWACELWQRGRETRDVSLWRAFRASFDRRTLLRMAPALGVTAIYFVIRARVMAPFPFDATRHAADVGAYQYFLTQLTAWWYYVYRWLMPVRLVSDYLAYPVYRSWSNPIVLLAAAGWIAVGVLLVKSWRSAPYLLFLAIAALALLSPTSSVAPLAEMVNEHRPYLPLGILSLALIIPIGAQVSARPRGRAGPALALAAAVVLLALCSLTYRRNDVFATPESFWKDVLDKAPSSRAHLNYGIALMRENEMAPALEHFHRSLALAPYWHFTLINLGVAYQHLGQLDSARIYYDRAVQYDRYTGLGLTWRGEFRLAQADYAGARDDFLSSLPIGLQRYRNAKGLATAYAGLGDVERSREQIDQMLLLDRDAALADIGATPVLHNALPAGYAVSSRNPTMPCTTAKSGWRMAGMTLVAGAVAMSACTNDKKSEAPATTGATTAAEGDAQLMGRGLDLLYKKADPIAAEGVFRDVLQRNPTHYGAQYQLAVSLDRGGRPTEARPLWTSVLKNAEASRDSATARTARTRLASPDTASESAMMALGLDLLYRRNNPPAAAEQFRGVLRKNPRHYGATYQLAVALDKAGQGAQARPVWQQVLGMATMYKDQRTADTARARLAASR